MSRLQAGQRRRAAFAASVLAIVGAVLVAPPATAETIGGERLAAATVTVDPGPDARDLPRIKAATWVLADAETGEVLAHKGAHVQRAPASTLKMLTALTVLPQTDPDATYVATDRAAGIYGARVGLRPGRTYTLDQLWYAVFLPSANDAAIAVAEANGGVKRTIRQMNDVAFDLRALDTVARTTSGLDAPGQRSSAYDLALMARAGLAREDFAHYASTRTARFPDVKGKGSHRIYTTNRLLLHGWKGTIGVKTGFTSQAGRTFVGAATRNGRTLIVSLMGIRESTEDAARKLLKWGFDNADAVAPVGQLVERGSPLPQPDAGTEPPAAPAVSVSSTGGAGAAPGPDPSASGPTPSEASLPLSSLAGALVAMAIIGAGVLLWRGRRAGRHAS